MRSSGWLYVAVVWTLASCLASARALADDALFSPPPPPELTPAWWELEMGASAVVPIERSAICPPVRECVLNVGVGLGMRLTYRTPDGLGWLVGYDLWVLDSDSLYEIALAHAVRVGVRYVLDPTSRVQPWLGATVGFLALGDASSVVTAGGLVTAGGGAHVELSDDVALHGSIDAWLISTAPFQTREGTIRSDPFGVNLVVQVMLGAVVRIGDLVAP